MEQEMSGSTPGSVIKVDIPDPRKFSVKKVAKMLRNKGHMRTVREKLMELESYEMFVGSNYLLESDEDFIQMKSVVQAVTGMSGDEIEEMLAECIWEPDANGEG